MSYATENYVSSKSQIRKNTKKTSSKYKLKKLEVIIIFFAFDMLGYHYYWYFFPI